jgi:hypothetical protein
MIQLLDGSFQTSTWLNCSTAIELWTINVW